MSASISKTIKWYPGFLMRSINAPTSSDIQGMGNDYSNFVRIPPIHQLQIRGQKSYKKEPTLL